MGPRADRCYSSEQALNQLLSVQRAFLEQRDEMLNRVLHTLLLLGCWYAATMAADAQRWYQPRPKAVGWMPRFGSASCFLGEEHEPPESPRERTGKGFADGGDPADASIRCVSPQ